MIHKTTVKKWFELFLLMIVCSAFSLQAQNQLDKKFKVYANKWYDMEYQVPKNYHGIVVESFYNANEKFLQSALQHGIKYEKHDIVIAFALVSTKPDDTPRGIRIREVFGDPNRISQVVITNEADTTLSKVKYLDSLELKKVNASRGVIYNMKIINKFKGIYTRCKKIAIFKDNIGRLEVLFFYNKGDDALVDEEIENTWGMLKFK